MKPANRKSTLMSKACDDWLANRSKGLGYNIGPVTNDKRKRWFKAKVKQGKPVESK